LREQNPGFEGPPEPPPPTLEELLQQSLDAVKARKLAPGPQAFNPKERGSFSLKSLAGDLAGDEPKEWELEANPDQQGEIDDSNVEKIAAGYRRGDPVPPIVAYETGDGKARIIEGHHRMEAAKLAGLKPDVIVIPEAEFKARRAEGETLDDIEWSVLQHAKGTKKAKGKL
jgi:hypothetical protein